MRHPVCRVGLTGGIGSGKSTVARLLQERGAAVIDADAAARQVTGAGGAAIEALVRAFGLGAVTAEGALDRDAMRALAFKDPLVRQKLEAIIHPLVAADAQHRAGELLNAGYHCLIFDVPLLVESGRWRSWLDRILVVDCSHETQIARVLERERGHASWTSAAVEQVIAAQASRARRLSAADLCIFNDAVTLDDLNQIVGEVAVGFGL